MPLKKSAVTSYAEVNVLVDRLPVDCCNQALKQPEAVLVWYYYGVNELLQSLPSMPVQVAKGNRACLPCAHMAFPFRNKNTCPRHDLHVFGIARSTLR